MRAYRILLCLNLVVAFFLAGCTKTPQEKYAAFLETGEKYMQAKDYNRAILEFQNAVRAQPKEAEAYYRLALAFLGAGRPRESVAPLRRATEINPKHVQAQLRLADLMLRTHNDQLRRDAEAQMQSILTGNPGDEDALFTLAATRAQLGRTADAERFLNEALGRSPGHLRSAMALALLKVSQNDLPAAEETLKKTVAQAPNSVDAAIALGTLYAVIGNLAEAQSQFSNAIRIDAKNAPAWNGLATVQVKMGRKAEAEESYKRLTSLTETEHRLAYVSFLINENRRPDAIRELERMFKANPGDRLARSSLVAGYLALDRPEEAEKILGEALKKNDRDMEALLQRSQVHLRRSRYDMAAADLDRVTTIDPVSAQAHYLKAQVFRYNRDLPNQKQELHEALRLAPGSIRVRLELADAHLASYDSKAALQILDEAPEAQRRTIPFVTARIWALIAAGDMKMARVGVDKVLAVAKLPEVFLQDALLKIAEQNWAGARSSLESALKTNPTDARALSLLTQVYSAQNQRPAATEKLRQAATQQPRSLPIQIFWAQWLLENNQKAEARAALTAATAANPKDSTPLLLLARLDFSEQKLKDARDKLNTLLASDPRHTDARMLLAEVEETAADYPKAMEQYRKVIAIDGQNARALNNLAFLLSRDVSKLDDAMNMAQKAKQLAPESSQIQDTLGWIYYRKGLYKMAVVELERALADGERPTIQYHLGMTYNRLGNPTKGGRLIAAALAKNPKLADTEVP